MRILYITLGGSGIRGGTKLFVDISRILLRKYKDVEQITIIILNKEVNGKDNSSSKKLFEKIYGDIFTQVPVHIFSFNIGKDNISKISKSFRTITDALSLASKANMKGILFVFLLSNYLSNIKFDRVFLKIKKLMASHDIIHVAPWYSSFSIASIGLARTNNRKIFMYPFYHPYLYAPTEDHFLRKLLDPQRTSLIKLMLYRNALKLLDAITVSTPYEKKLFESFNNNSIFIGEGIDLEYVSNIIQNIKGECYDSIRNLRDSCELIVSYVGSKSYGKGYYHLLKTLDYVLMNTNNRICLISVGSKPYGYKFTEIVELEYRLRRNKILVDLGLVDEINKYRVLMNSDVVVLPSVFETIPLVFLEAWALGKPVVGASIPTVRSVITYEGDGGFLVQFNDVKMLADILVGMARGEYNLKDIGRRGREKVYKTYNLLSVVKKLHNIYAMK